MKVYANPLGFYLIGIPLSFAAVSFLLSLVLCLVSQTPFASRTGFRLFISVYLTYMLPSLVAAYVLIEDLQVGEGGLGAVAFWGLIVSILVSLLVLMLIRHQLVHLLAVEKLKANLTSFVLFILLPPLSVASFLLSDFLTIA